MKKSKEIPRRDMLKTGLAGIVAGATVGSSALGSSAFAVPAKGTIKKEIIKKGGDIRHLYMDVDFAKEPWSSIYEDIRQKFQVQNSSLQVQPQAFSFGDKVRSKVIGTEGWGIITNTRKSLHQYSVYGQGLWKWVDQFPGCENKPIYKVRFETPRPLMSKEYYDEHEGNLAHPEYRDIYKKWSHWYPHDDLELVEPGNILVDDGLRVCTTCKCQEESCVGWPSMRIAKATYKVGDRVHYHIVHDSVWKNPKVDVIAKVGIIMAMRQDGKISVDVDLLNDLYLNHKYIPEKDNMALISTPNSIDYVFIKNISHKICKNAHYELDDIVEYKANVPSCTEEKTDTEIRQGIIVKVTNIKCGEEYPYGGKAELKPYYSIKNLKSGYLDYCSLRQIIKKVS